MDLGQHSSLGKGSRNVEADGTGRSSSRRTRSGAEDNASTTKLHTTKVETHIRHRPLFSDRLCLPVVLLHTTPTQPDGCAEAFSLVPDVPDNVTP